MRPAVMSYAEAVRCSLIGDVLSMCQPCREKHSTGRVLVDGEFLEAALLTARRPRKWLPVRVHGCGFHWWVAPWVAELVLAMEPLWNRETVDGSWLAIRTLLRYARELSPRKRAVFVTLARVAPLAAAEEVKRLARIGSALRTALFAEAFARAEMGEP